jgi:hypothetical protein
MITNQAHDSFRWAGIPLPVKLHLMMLWASNWSTSHKITPPNRELQDKPTVSDGDWQKEVLWSVFL